MSQTFNFIESYKSSVQKQSLCVIFYGEGTRGGGEGGLFSSKTSPLKFECSRPMENWVDSWEGIYTMEHSLLLLQEYVNQSFNYKLNNYSINYKSINSLQIKQLIIN